MSQIHKNSMKLFLTILSISWASVLFSQNRTNIWELSYSTSLSIPNCEMKYDGFEMDTNLIYRVMSIGHTNASICDTGGNLLFYSNGLTIGNSNYDTLLNAENFNPGFTTDFYEPDGMLINQAVLILPFPDQINKYYIFSVSGDLISGDIQPLHLNYSVIDMDLEGGLGGIVDSFKTLHAIEDTLANGGLSAVKHGNGRDWWVIAPAYKHGFYKLLISPFGLDTPIFQDIGSVTTYDIVTQAVFSPDGSKFCYSNAGGTFNYLHFDRCTGEFSESQTGFSLDSFAFRGCSFSPNNRFLYLSTPVNLYQYDTWDANMIANVIHVATWDSFTDPTFHTPVVFAMQQLAPDGKIYISPWNGVEFFNVINSPDSFGIACEFTLHSYVLPQYNNGIPSFPNYDLGALEGSLCDTIVVLPANLQPPRLISFTIFPNPVNNRLNIDYQLQDEALLEIFDINGRCIVAASLYPYFKNRIVDIHGLPTGVYLATVTQNSRQLWSDKVVVER